ncbi:carbon storage regulator CsrA [Novilysobacter defluvii]|uniref:Translational regulator CsrA n=2 Tax=Novilysobacter TaxID=3382699 RepID=A0A0A0M9H7_9GAMM|nr:carbon storage regulator CsrA [Lysobacter defluvii]KGO98879.1 carbon storage regulator CsrA [Lysobacter defluvii IMMIB APB-9 = DSM 18482]
MLIISRRPGEAVTVGTDIRVTVLAINGKQVRLGVTAPRVVEVHRQEVYEEITGQRVAGATPTRKPTGLSN